MSQLMKIRAARHADFVEVKVLIQHEMETGLRKDEATGRLIPAHFIELVEANLNNRTVLSMQWGVAVAQNPYLAFRVSNSKPGDVLVINALDNRGESYHGEVILS